MNDTDTSVLLEVIKEQNKTIESLRKTIEEMSVNIILLREQIEYLNKKRYGAKSEKTAALTGQIVMDEVFEHGQFDEAETAADLTEDAEEDLTPKKASRKGYSREKALVNLPREEKLYTLTDEDKVCSVDGDRLFPAGKKYLRTEIEYTPASMKLVEIYVETAECRTCRTCRKEGRSYMIQAEPDQPVLQHSMASPSSVAWTMYQKYVNHVPLYRQEKDWHNLG
ncbi:transposase, partial [Proteiniclasticum sp. SCR006]